MQRKALGIIGLFGLILVAVGFGYWDMLNSEKLRIAEESATPPVNIVGDAVMDAGNASNDEAQQAAQADTAANAPAPTGASAETPTPAPAQSANGEISATADGSAIAPERAPLSNAQAASSSPANAGSADARSAGKPVSQTADASPSADTRTVDAARNEPSFDILRVEPSGETVVAGNAKPAATVALIDGGRTIGEAKANAEGQFALALDAPLTPGEHSIALQATDETGQATASRQTAIVSVPQDATSGQVLAMIDSPGAPSRIVEMPKAANPQEPLEPQDDQVADAGAPKDEPKAKSAANGSGTQTAIAEAVSGIDRIAGGKSDRAKAGETSASAITGPVASGETAAPVGGPDAIASTTPSPGAASSAAMASDAAGTPKAAAAATLRVEAVELQGRTISVAGAATSGSKVRVYVDNALVAEDQASGDDRFLASGKAELSIGRHLVRADQLDNGGQVVARAEVPFDRPEGERVAAIAPPAGMARPSGSSSPAVSDSSPNATVADPPAETPARPDRVAAGGTGGDTEVASVDGGASTNASGANARATGVEQDASANRPAKTSTGGSDAADVGDATNVASAETVVKDGSAPPSDMKSAGTEGAGSGGTADASFEPATGAQPGPTGQRSGEDATARVRGDMVFDGTAGEPELAPGAVNRQAALTSVDGRVIIRKGDTLWRISREAYGLGRRYTVIYLANGQQIRNPHLIYPGQVFRLPSDNGKG